MAPYYTVEGLDADDIPPQVFSGKTVLAIAFLGFVGSLAYFSVVYMPKKATWRDRYAWIWLTYDAMSHFSWEAIFLWNSIGGRMVFRQPGLLTGIVKEYAMADHRWGLANPIIVSLEMVMVLGAGPLACHIIRQINKDDPARHYWIIILCTVEIFVTWMKFVPEYLIGGRHLATWNPLYLWFYLIFMNGLWVVMPSILLYDSYRYISTSLRFAQKERPSVYMD